MIPQTLPPKQRNLAELKTTTVGWRKPHGHFARFATGRNVTKLNLESWVNPWDFFIYSVKIHYFTKLGITKNVYNKLMAIKPKCDKCGQELTKFGAILLSPPDEASTVKKFHLCTSCYEDIETKLKYAK